MVFDSISGTKKFLGSKEIGVVIALFTLVTIFSLLSEHFFTLDTFGVIGGVSSEIGLLALGTAMLMIAGEFDLSLGSNFALSGMVFAILTTSYEVNGFIALLVALLCGASIGLFNAVVTIKTGIPSFITTLGSMLIFRAVVLIVTDGFPVAALDSNMVMHGLAFDLGHGFKASIFVWLMIAAVFFYVLNFHRLGNLVMATGGNKEAAFAMGIKVNLVKLSCFVVAGLLAALAGIIQYAHLMSLSPTAGEQYELRAIAIAVIGGTALNGGAGTVMGTLFATIIMGVLASGLVQAGVSTYWFRALVGVILVLAVVINTRFMKLTERLA